MRRIGLPAGALLAAVALLHVTCSGVPLLAPGGSTITLVANPTFIPSNGGVSEISAIVSSPTGGPVHDGTVVQFFTDLGRIDREGKTNDGVARVNLVADSRSGTAHVIAMSGGAAVAPSPQPSASPTTGGGSTTTGQGTATITIGNINVSRIVVRADPDRIGPGANSTRIVATVYDKSGNTMANVPVQFFVCGSTASSGSCPAPSGQETLESGGAPVFTNNNGEASDVVRTRSTVTGSFAVEARVAGDNAFVTGTVVVPVL